MARLLRRNGEEEIGKQEQSRRREVAVVGGSAAGFFTAYLLARGGASVQILERSEPLDPAPRTLIVTSRMRDLLGPPADSSVVNQIRQFELFTDGRSACVSLHRPDLIIERATLIRELAAQAECAGARTLLGRRFLQLSANGRGVSLQVERCRDGVREELHADTVVGADGALSKVAEAAGWPRQETVPLIQAIVRLPAGFATDTVRVWFVPEDTPYFFWLIPESPTRGAIGLIAEDGQRARRALEAFLSKHRFAPLAYQGARIPVYTRWVPVHRQMGEGRVYLVGDAAGQVKVTTVGGIVTGLRGALGVAEAILNSGHSRELRALRRELDVHLLLRKTLHRFRQADYSRLLDLLNVSARESLGQYTRDEATRVLWNLCRSQPRLLLLGLRGLLTRRPFFRRPPGGRTDVPAGVPSSH
jgi:flavin-dependent dehydrogenase